MHTLRHTGVPEMRKYVVDITPDGISIEASGFIGNACLKELDEFQRILAEVGIKTDLTNQKKKAEMYATPATHLQEERRR